MTGQKSPHLPLHLYYGGSFDPVHRGHLHVAKTMAERFESTVHLIPTGNPKHRQAARASDAQRVAMLELSCADDAHLVVDTREMQRDTPSYTAITLDALRAELGEEAPIGWVLGADSFLSLPRWHRWEGLFDQAHFIVFARPGYDLSGMSDALQTALDGRLTNHADDLRHMPSGKVYVCETSLRHESSSAIRRAIAAGESWQHMVMPEVAAYIEAQGLYQDMPNASG